MLDDAGARSRHAKQAILAYLARHPSAADSEQGIAQWWLPEMNAEAPPADVRRALDELVQQQALGRTTLPDGSVIYRAVPSAVP